MKQVSIQALKATLSVAISEAEAGNTIVITRHNEPVAQLGPVQPIHLHRGKAAGIGRIKPALRRGIKVPYLPLLLEDRGDR
jgi:antitoxin (DNA-binding transcriptional repressor) of toxin-antitoxin stability system